MKRSSRIKRTLSATAVLALASMTLTACFEEPSPHEAIRDFLVGWKQEQYDLAAARTDADPKIVAKALSDAKLDLDANSFEFKINSVKRSGDQAKADFTAEVDLGENNPLWVYDGALPLRVVDGRWKVHWSPSVLHPKLGEGQRFAVPTKPVGRRAIVDRDGASLQTDMQLYVVGVTPGQLGADAEEVCNRLAGITGYAADRLLSKVRSSPPSDFVPLVTLGAKRHQELRAQLQDIKGIQINQEPHPVAPADPKGIVGSVSTLTARGEQQLGGPQRAGDSIGRSGLQRAYQDHLTGSTVTKVVTLDLKTGEEVAVLDELESQRDAVEVHTTIDSSIQRAAQTAVQGISAGTLVAVEASTGKILAVSTAGSFDQIKDSLDGQYPGGTAMSIVAAYALLKADRDPKMKLPCAPRRTVGGAWFENSGAQSVQPTASGTLQSNFANGCVTGLASLARLVDAEQLARSSEELGIGKPWKLPLASFSGKWPKTPGDAEKAQAIAGQNIEISPLGMALIAGSLASGTWNPPLLVTKPTSPDPSQATLPQAQPAAVPLDGKARDSLVSMMRLGVRAGTARPAGTVNNVHGIRADVPGKTLSWFVGWQGDVAIAVLADKADPSALAGRFFSAVGNSS
ncbi:penicillin-binding transpeptidase domain-containing protein [Nonomuraea soli]|uniref:Cell division protein FtsI/penicillin-binding protein 2 n=1 Tax=Nonomuraea soli TaxID=1032476 RepID=A0A7W0CKQ4_9ACTN|nr:penicillin-binding transpeptidase domain-containing protein [Nonomuraea soli]MBA2892757.1 cell division protein FtsI/penicillin-binding protein 2 [Nonomuraea soli]